MQFNFINLLGFIIVAVCVGVWIFKCVYDVCVCFGKWNSSFYIFAGLGVLFQKTDDGKGHDTCDCSHMYFLFEWSDIVSLGFGCSSNYIRCRAHICDIPEQC